MLSVPQVLAWCPGAITEAADLLRTQLRVVQAEVDRLPGAVRLARGHWHGAAGNAAQDRLLDQAARGDEVVDTLRRAVHSLGSAADQLSGARSRLATLVTAAEDDGMTVQPSGQVDVPEAVLDLADLLAPGAGAPDLANRARQHTALITAALRWADEADAEAARTLCRVRFPGTLDAEASAIQSMDLTSVRTPVPGTDPRAVATWWGSLTALQQDALQAREPRVVGNLDGIPVVDRDLANRSVLTGELARFRARLADLPPEPGWYLTTGDRRVPPRVNPAWASWKSEHDRLTQLVRGSEVIASRVGASEGPPYYLVGFAPELGNGRAILARGNPDTATNVGVFVTGTATRLGGISTDLGRSKKMSRAAAATKGSSRRSLSMVTWYGYDAPQTVLPEAADLSYAEHGAPLLDGFMTALRATHRGDTPSHNTVVAHSYGATLVGWAASHGHTLDADDVVLVASPGEAVGSGWFDSGTVEDLHLQPGTSAGHVYATRSANDPIRWAAGTHLGADPVADYFGAHVFDASPEGGHGDYWDRYTNPALKGMGLVIAGQGPWVPTSISQSEATDQTMVPAL